MSTPVKYNFYIPRIYGNYTVDDIIATFRLLYIGEVSRVDISEKNEVYMSAFVHMDHLYDSEIAWQVINTTYNTNSPYRLWVDTDSYWMLLKNINPVAETHLNSSQLAENIRLLEEKVKMSDDKIDRLEYVIHKLCRTIYEQSDIYDTHNFMHYNEHYSEGYLSTSALTRTKQLAQYKQDIAAMKEAEPWDEYVHKYTSHIVFSPQSSDKEEGEVSDSDTHSSMPSLINYEVTSDSDVMPGLISREKSICDSSSSSDSDSDSLPDLIPCRPTVGDDVIDDHSDYYKSSTDSEGGRVKPGKRRKYRRDLH